ncbi:MAG: aminoglycoside phosphotransferase family protein [Armatimonadetes bacterium]|nr:aminoglycoside phosphotransferase family protein [Armatimonadota bacterium]
MSHTTGRYFEALRQVVGQFPVFGEVIHAQPYGTGHINETYAVTVEQGRAKIRYILQRINENVFRDIPAVQENIGRVTEHIREKLLATRASDISGRVLRFLPAADGRNYTQDQDGGYWRLCPLIERSRTFDILESAQQAELVAKAFGHFQLQLADLDASLLHETIPNFHDGPSRMAAFRVALELDAHNRAAECAEEIAFLLEHAWVFDVFPKALAEGRVPLRITHNDTKVNNVMFDDESGQAICVIDLDTVMPGLALYDFGDMVRTGTNTAAEDERDLRRVSMDIALFEALARGYWATACGFLNRAERDHLVFAGKMLTLIIGTRFLTDHLNGDTYFRIHRPGHNLDRCRTQFRLVESITRQEEAMAAIVESL